MRATVFCGPFDMLAGRLDLTGDLDGVPAGYAAMDQRKTVKVMMRP